MSRKGSSKARIAECFMQLAVESSNPRERVGVTDIVRRLGMDRKSFYRHFDNTSDLVIWIFRSELAELLEDRAFQDHRLECPDPALKDNYGNLPFFARAPLIDGSLDQSRYTKALVKLLNGSFTYYQRILSYPCYLDFYYYLISLYKPAIRGSILMMFGDDRELSDEVVAFLSEYHTTAFIGRLPYHYTVEKRPLPDDGLERVWNYTHEVLRESVDALATPREGGEG